ncbi:MAG: dTDP-glucose 4,6-dehydratase [Chloroflexi bacterium]|nr:dTDP-glucose 4,6-dehydratase [Chloroflexota bacterium]MBU1750880.1 dTDP-glucose 4,6-dehydratase [Chloroflexota bacterium]
MRNLLITGGAGFIGSNFLRYMLEQYPHYRFVVYDVLNYRGNLDNLRDLDGHPRYLAFVRGDICDRPAVEKVVREYDVDTIVNFAAETHVDRSIIDADAFIRTDVYGTYVLLEVVKDLRLERLHHVSTDEVYGEVLDGSSVETDKLEARSPYAASKAGAELLCQAYHTTYNVPVTVTRGANNIGPYQYPENVVPLFITNAIDDLPLPVYGDGRQVRPYQYVLDHCQGIDVVLHHGTPGEAYNVGPDQETVNLDMTYLLLDLLGKPRSLIQFVTDRPGHDRRYSLNSDKLKALGWEPAHTFEQALEKTVRWYEANEWWWRKIKSGEYKEWYRRNYEDRAALVRELRADDAG